MDELVSLFSGVVEVDEGAIRYYGAAVLGGEIALRDLDDLAGNAQRVVAAAEDGAPDTGVTLFSLLADDASCKNVRIGAVGWTDVVATTAEEAAHPQRDLPRGILGSLAYVDRHLATRAPSDDPALAGLSNNRTWRSRWPIEPRAGYGDLVAYFNLDNGSGKIRGINAEGNVAAAPIFQEWLAPFASMGATTVSLRNSGGTDHVYMQTVGVPGYQFIQDPLDYSARIHHTSIDSYDHLKPEDMRQAAIILASFLLNAANRDEPLPRMPLPTQSTPSDPFEYPAED